MVVESRQNLEGFCREYGLPIDAPVVVTATRVTEREATKVAPTPGRAPRSLAWVAIGAIVFLVAMLLVLRLRSSHEAVTKPEPVAARQAEATAPRIAAPTTRPAPIEQGIPPAAASPLRDRNVAPDKRSAAGGITVATSQLCRTFSTSGTWRCDPVGQSVAPGPIVFYTRVRSRRDAAVVHRWYQGDTLRQSVTLDIRANATEGYRTYSRLTVDDGDWRVEVRSVDGSLLHEQRFIVR